MIFKVTFQKPVSVIICKAKGFIRNCWKFPPEEPRDNITRESFLLLPPSNGASWETVTGQSLLSELHCRGAEQELQPWCSLSKHNIPHWLFLLFTVRPIQIAEGSVIPLTFSLTLPITILVFSPLQSPPDLSFSQVIKMGFMEKLWFSIALQKAILSLQLSGSTQKVFLPSSVIFKEDLMLQFQSFCLLLKSGETLSLISV